MPVASPRQAVLRHVLRSYGGAFGVWVGFLASAASYVLLYGVLAVTVTRFLLAALSQTSHSPEHLAVEVFIILAASGSLALLGNYAFVRSTDLRYANLVGEFYVVVARSKLSKLQAERLDSVKNLFREHMDGTIGILRLLRDDVLRIVLACLVPALYLATYDPLIGALVAAIAILQAWVALAATAKVGRLRKLALATYHSLTRQMFDALRNAGLLRIADATSRRRRELEALASLEAGLFWRRHHTFFLFEYGKALLTATCFAVVFWITADRYQGMPEAAYLVVLSAMYLLQIMQAASSAADIAPRLQEKWSNVAESMNMLDRLAFGVAADSTDLSGPVVTEGEEGLRFDNMTFGYSGEKAERPIFRGVSLQIPRGAHVAISGQNGAGKSTLFRLILGLEQPSTGRVLVEGCNLAVSPDALRAQLVSWLPPAAPVLDGTIEENLRLFDPSASDDVIQRAMTLSGMDAMMSNVSLVLSSPVGDGGNELSEGQKARLALARCLVRSASLYLLDEPTAAIDDDNAEKIVSNVLSSLGEKTVLAVVHSDALIEKFPYVLRCANETLIWVRRPPEQQFAAS